MERRLAAIFAADMVTFSRLMEADELGTLSRQKKHRAELIDPAIARHNGRIIKLTGDGMIAEFASVVDAVQCAVFIQNEMKAREGDVAEDRRIRYRIAVNLGDVIFDEDEDEVYGDGVNIAARLEALAEPGGVVVSGEAYDHLKTKVEVGYRLLGEKRLKNIATPVRVYQVVADATAVATRPAAGGVLRSRKLQAWIAAVLAVAVLVAGVAVWKPWRPEIARASVDRMSHPLPEKPSLVVLPFNDFSEESGQAYFADGMTEDLITDLSKISGIFVISRNSSWTYKDRAVKSQEVAEELGVQYILEGSVRRSGDQVRINAQLIDALGGHHMWADRYDSRIDDVFALQDKVIEEITAALAVQLTATEASGIGAVETANPLAYDSVLHGAELLRRGGEEDITGAIAAFEKAIEIDPDYHRAYAGLAAAHWRIVQGAWFLAAGGGYEKAWRAVHRNLERAMERPSALAYSIRAEIYAEQGRHAEAFDELDKALALAPNDPDIHVAKARVLNATGRAAEAEAALRYAARFDPLETTRYLRELGVAQLNQKKYLEAEQTMRRVRLRDASQSPDIITLVSALGHLGELADVPELIREYDEIAVPSYYDPFTAEESLVWWYSDMFGYDPDYRQHLYEGLVKAGVPQAAGTDVDYDTVREHVTREEGLYYVADAPRISTEEAQMLWEDKAAVFIDVRAALDFDAGHIPGAKHLSLITGLSKEALLEVADPGDTLVFGCHGPHCPYSAYGAVKARIWGFEDARYYPGGFPAWAEARLPVEAAEKQ